MKGSGRRSPKSLRDEVRDALLAVLRDKDAPATARAIAGRSLVELLGEEPTRDTKRISTMTIEELDAEIAANQRNGN